MAVRVEYVFDIFGMIVLMRALSLCGLCNSVPRLNIGSNTAIQSLLRMVHEALLFRTLPRPWVTRMVHPQILASSLPLLDDTR